MGKFNGIDTFHDGLAVSDYVNMIPLGDTCIDRQGDVLVSRRAYSPTAEVRGSFLDSSKKIYEVIEGKVHVFFPDGDTYAYAGVLGGYIRDEFVSEFELLNKFGKVTFVESSIKPSTIYLCDGKYIYKWSSSELVAKMMMSPGVYPSNDQNLNGAKDAAENFYGAVLDGSEALDMSEMAYIDSIDWFDNKLVAVQKSKNTVWLTCTDPEQFTREPSLNPWGDQYQLWNNWYASTNSADKLNTAVAFGGMLYLLNDNSIELWGRTGNEQAPLQSSTNQVIHHGARDPLVLGDYMYVVANDSVGSDYIALIQGGQFKRISSFEIDHRLGHAIDIVPIAMRGETYVMVRNNGGLDGFVFGEDKWWHWVHPSSDSDGIMKSVFKNFALTLHGALVKFDDDTRTTYLGGQIVRYIRDSFVNWHTRKLFRKVAVAMDSGRVTDPNINDSDLLKQIYIRLSTNRGLSFGQYLFRKLGRSGLNNKIIEWVGLGSGNSLLLEIGTSAGYKLQLYDIEITAQ